MSLYSACETELYAFVFSMVPHHSDADDIIQATFIALWESHDRYDSARPFLPWACRFAYHEVLTYRNQRRHRARYLTDDVLKHLADERLNQVTRNAERRAALENCLAELSRADRHIIETRYGGEQSIEDLARDLGRTPNTLYKALQRLRVQLLGCISRKLSVQGGGR